jgi:hypothetical protein
MQVTGISGFGPAGRQGKWKPRKVVWINHEPITPAAAGQPAGGPGDRTARPCLRPDRTRAQIRGLVTRR